MNRTTALMIAAGALVSVAGQARAQTQYTWQFGIGSCYMGSCLPYWNESGNWTQSTWAGVGDRVVIDTGLGGSVQFIWLQLYGFPAHSGAVPVPSELVVPTNGNLAIGGVANYPGVGPVQNPLEMVGDIVMNDGQIIISDVTGTPTGLYFGDVAGVTAPTITGSGMIVLDTKVSFNTELTTFGPYTTFGATSLPMFHDAGHTIKGIGTVHGDFVNSGTFLNDFGSQSRPLRLRTPEIVQTSTGLIRADGGGVTQAEVHLVGETFAGMRVVGGTIGGIGGGIIRVYHEDTVFESLTVDGLVRMNGGVQTLTCKGDITNDGEIVLTGGTGGVDGHTIAIDGDSTWSTTTGGDLHLGAVNNIATRAKIVPVTTGDVLTNGASHAIRGNGEIHIEVDNQGIISGDEGTGNGWDMWYLNPVLTNSGDVLAENGAQLHLDDVMVTQSSTGQIRGIGSGSDVFLETGTVVVGGKVGGIGDGAVIAQDGSAIDTLTINGLLEISTSGTVITNGDITNTGTVQFPASFNATELQFADSSTWSGNGEIVLNTFNNGTGHANLGYSDPANILTNGADHTIRGNGDITINLNNLGTVQADKGTNWMMRLRDLDKSNSGTMRSINGTRLVVDGITVTQSATGQIVAGAGPSKVDLLNTPVIIGGTVGTEADGIFEIADATTAVLDGVATVGRVGITTGRTIEIRNTITNNGEIVVHTPVPGFNIHTKLHRSGPVTVTGNGRIVVNSTGSSSLIAQINYNTLATDVFTNAGNHRIEGKGGLHGKFVNEAVIAPGSDYVNQNDLTGRLIMVDGGIDCEPASRIEMQIGGTVATATVDEYDRILGETGTTFECDGELILENINGFAGLNAGEFIDIIVAPGGVTGTFDTVTSIGGASYDVVYMSDRVRLEMGSNCYADCDSSGVLNIFDYICFGNAYANFDPYADCDGSGSLNIFDYICFGNAYAAGCQ
ncbi:MAG: hypothetical protein H6815_00865 [Phycisphaeraceae bacterium]|nr:hypothetical protein [Phycisphaerales bacterium]MCB9858976.1 hypothetical protein [Phycisphaeraceae bacterium]